MLDQVLMPNVTIISGRSTIINLSAYLPYPPITVTAVGTPPAFLTYDPATTSFTCNPLWADIGNGIY